MYSPPAATALPSSNSSIQQPHSLPSPSSSSSSSKQTIKLPSLPPFPSLVSSLGEGRQSNSPNSGASSAGISPYPPYPSYAHHRQEPAVPFESAGRLGWPSEGGVPLHEPARSRTAASNTTFSSSTAGTPIPASTPSGSASEERKPGLPLPVGYSDHTYRGGLQPSPRFGGSTGTMSGIPVGNGPAIQHIERESSIRTGSSASTSEPPLSPRHIGGAGPEKRRRLSAAHETYSHHVIHAPGGDDLHDHDAQMIDELSPMLHQGSAGSQLDEEIGSPQTGDDSNDKKGANGRTLKQTKRAAQNRAAQQAFRKRKEERIKELEEKEKILNNLVARETELVKKERILAERENAFIRNSQHGNPAIAAQGATSGPSSSQQAGGEASSSSSASMSTATTATNDWDRAFASAPVASSIQHVAERLEASNRANEALRSEIEQLKDRLMDKSNLIESLRRSLEDLGAENRSLRDANRKQAQVLEMQTEHARAGAS